MHQIGGEVEGKWQGMSNSIGGRSGRNPHGS